MKYLGVDWGLKRMGLALSEGLLASPYGTLEVHNFQDALNQLSEIVGKEKIDILVIGLPEGKSRATILAASNKLQEMGFRLVFTDETLSSKEAQKLMIEMGISQRGRRDDNSAAAAIILQRFLDEKS